MSKSKYIVTNDRKWLMEADHVEMGSTVVDGSYHTRDEAKADHTGVYDLTTDNQTMTSAETLQGHRITAAPTVKLNFVGLCLLVDHIEDQSQDKSWYQTSRQVEFDTVLTTK